MTAEDGADAPGDQGRGGLAFGPFQLFPDRRLLLEGGRPVRLGSRAMTILIVLLERAGGLVGRDELVERVWGRTFVDDANLRVHIGALRRVLGDGQGGQRYIVNVPGRGYGFVAPMAARVEAPAGASPVEPPAAPQLPAPLARMIGRDEAARHLAETTGRHRLVTIVGPGGVGKTMLALAVAESAAARHGDGARFVDLAPVADPAAVAGAVATALGLSVPVADPLPDLLSGLQDRDLLILIDNCEHLVEAVAELAEALLRGAPRLHVLATSREPLRAEGEWIHRLPPLAAPTAAARPDAAQALAYPAVQLFVERASAGHDAFEITDANAPAVAELCRRLDGIPLAIELAAAHVGPLGLAGLSTQLDDRFRVLTRGRRTALPRQQTLRATMDWSYALLDEDEQGALQRLALFRGRFPMESAVALVRSERITAGEALDIVTGLVAKSLVVADISREVVDYRLLETTRAYALARLAEQGGAADMARRHALHCIEHFRTARADWEALPTAAWVEAYGGRLDDVRAALDWAFGPEGDIALGRSLTAVSAPMWFQLSLLDEYRLRAAQALAGVTAACPLDPRLEMQLLEAQGHALWDSSGRMAASFARMLEIAEASGAVEQQLSARRGLWLSAYMGGDYPAALDLARDYRRMVDLSDDPRTTVMGERMMALTLHVSGAHEPAQAHAERAVRHPAANAPTALTSRFQFDTRVTTRGELSRILWVRGLPDQAAELAGESVRIALSTGHDLSICYAIATAACPIALWRGEDEEAARLTELLLERASRRSAGFWRNWGRRLAWIVELRRTGTVTARHPPSLGPPEPSLADYLVTLHEGLVDEALVARAESGAAGWSSPEILRAEGERIVRSGRPDADRTAEPLFRTALEVARRQGALAWELRAATSLARMLRRAGRRGDALAVLAPVHGRLTEGFATADARLALACLEDPDCAAPDRTRGRA